ncbi:SoxR reducing system RseC family protein [Ectothiorhodospira lacustris]|uniref:SoxR reducing system RseC family protein n=1 Tax=Ectothiorhodospira lacustris TaxID=2899127 RepID=UPI001EE79F30|nr:SoxR reducing system RseC family protein [Ectothiorhodospira lacustris]MCG5509392.1 SoxR reducing system RseC family protein [Ectothiorhodospira lacustris]MCG5521446.1 SoxR reducing system RseC family protein [Ectothiorhodospira lacustris]
MIEENARVIAVDEAGFAWVETQRKTACGSCSVQQGCGTSVIAKLFGQRRSQVRVIDPVGVSLGDEVIVGLEESALVRGSLAVYILPLLFMLVFAALGQWLWSGQSELPVVAAGLLGLLAGLAAVGWFTRRIRRDPRYQPVVVRRLGPPAIRIHGVLAP